jgi:Ni,Fe-hydrogenase III large subunit/Ni,Fe-hydrogenase III component G
MVATPEAIPQLDSARLRDLLQERFGTQLSFPNSPGRVDCLVRVKDGAVLPDLSRFLFWEAGGSFGGIIVEEFSSEWELHYLFHLRRAGWIEVLFVTPIENCTVPSIVAAVHAADWYEREAEDLFGIHFETHPRLGDFVLHNETWQEGVAPMRKRFDAQQPHFERQPDENWRPMLVVQDPGSFAMPVGPVYEGGLGESIHFLLETVGEDVIRAIPRLFYKYRAVEKIVEGSAVDDALLLAERFSATSSFAHSLAFCHAVERGWCLKPPRRACLLRTALCELERLRHHAGAIEGICQSTALSVPEAHAAMIEERLLRASCQFTGHRYLFGLNIPGGLRRDFVKSACVDLLREVERASAELRVLEQRLRYSSSFLDRLEEVGVVTPEAALDLDLAGPVGRASGIARDLRRVRPYAGYADFEVNVACEQEGDGYARLRVLFAEAQESARLIRHVLGALEPGDVLAAGGPGGPAAAFGWVEAPIGATLHWVRLDAERRVERYRILTPSFRNWLGLHVAVEDFAFQDFPIILATFALSTAESDR